MTESDEPVEVRVVEGEATTWARTAAHAIVEAVQRAVAVRGSCALALAGGTTPRLVHECLAADPKMPWDDIDVFFGDERCVPPDDPRSNQRGAHEVLGHLVGPSRWHRMRGEIPDREAAARQAERLLPRHLDVLLLGIGEDGHCASLFAGSPALDEERRRVVPVDAPKPPAERLTITPPVIAAARAVFVLARGATKATAVAAALEGTAPPQEVPARLARGGTWILDADAATRLRVR